MVGVCLIDEVSMWSPNVFLLMFGASYQDPYRYPILANAVRKTAESKGVVEGSVLVFFYILIYLFKYLKIFFMVFFSIES